MRKTRTSLGNFYNRMTEMLIDEYKNKYKFFETSDDTAYCYIPTKEIYVPTRYSQYPCLKNLFDVFHEIGHLETNTEDMETYQQEYLATVWAIKECNRRKIHLTPDIIIMYQKYIIKHRDQSPNRNKIPDFAIRLPFETKPVIDSAFNGTPYSAIVGTLGIPTRKNRKPKQIIDMPDDLSPLDIVASTSYDSSLDLIDYIKSMHVEYVDNRLKSGNLTLVGDEKSLSTVVSYICKVYGITGRYSSSLKAIKGRAGWWTKG